MDTVIVKMGQFHSHYPKDIAKGTVNAEEVLVQLDEEWEGLTVNIHWRNVSSGVEKNPQLNRDMPNAIPWEVLTDLGELRMSLVGMDGKTGKTVIKPTIWLTYGYVVDGVDPKAGDDPHPPTPSWEQQMVEQATQANQAAQAAQKAAEEAAESVASAGPYAEEAKEAAEAAKASQDAAATSAQRANEAAQTAQNAAGSIGDAVKRAEDAATAAGTAQSAAETAKGAAAQSAGTAQTAAATAGQAAQTAQEAATKAGQYLDTVEADAKAAASAAAEAEKSQEAAQTAAQEAGTAKDQANAAATTAQGHADAAGTAKEAAEQAATTAGNAQSGAAQSAQAAANSAQAAERAKQEAQNAAAAFPAPSPEVAGMVPMVNPEGDGYIFGEAGGGGAGGELLLAEYIHQGNQEIYFSSFDWASGIGECTEPHGLTKNAIIMIVPNNWWNSDFRSIHKAIPYEWITYNSRLYVYAVDETHIMVSSNNTTGVPVTVDPEGQYNSYLDCTQFHFEVGVTFKIENFPVKPTELRVTISGFIAGLSYRYIQTWVEYNNGKRSTGPYNQLLAAEQFGVLTKPYHAIYQLFNMEASLVGGAYVQYLMNYALFGRRHDGNFYGERGAFAKLHTYYDGGFSSNIAGDNSGHSHFYTVVCSTSWPIYANHSVIKVYAKAVKQE